MGHGGERGAVAGRGHLRASHADREHVIEVLKAAFVEGRLTKDELAVRVGQTLASRTYAHLAALTADIPAGQAAAQLPRRPALRYVSGAAKFGAFLAVGPAVLIGAYFTTNDHLAKWLFVFVIVYYMAMMVAGVALFDPWHQKRFGGQVPPRPARRHAFKGGRDRRLGDDLLRCETRKQAHARRPSSPGVTLA
jgi:Domain of unknown function (DUF1707)